MKKKNIPADVWDQVEVFVHKSSDASEEQLIAFVLSTSKDQPSLKRKRSLEKKKV